MCTYMQEPRKTRVFEAPGVRVIGVMTCLTRVLGPNMDALQRQCVLFSVWLLSSP